MLKTKLTSEPPPELKGAYVQKGDEWILDELADDHPVLATNKSLNTEQGKLKGQIDTLTAQNGNLERERDEYKSNATPHGYRVVPKEIAELGETVKQNGLSKDEIPALKSELDTFRNEKAEAAASATKREAAKFLGYTNEDAFARLAKEMDIAKDGDKFTVKVGEESKPLTKEFVESSDTFKPFLSSLTAQPAKPGNGNDPKPAGGTSIFEKMKELAKGGSKDEVRSIDEAFGRAA